MTVVALLRADMPLALRSVAGVPLVVHALRNVVAAQRVSDVTVVTRASECDTVCDVLTEHGYLPSDTVRVHAEPELGADLAALGGAFAARHDHAQDVGVVLAHEVGRAFAPAELIDRVAEAVLAGVSSVCPALPCTDTVKLVDKDGIVLDTPARSRLRVIQGPWGFSGEVFARACTTGRLAELSREPAHVVAGDPGARLVVTPFGLAMAEAALAESGRR